MGITFAHDKKDNHNKKNYQTWHVAVFLQLAVHSLNERLQKLLSL
jgi:hypothetical protein